MIIQILSKQFVSKKQKTSNNKNNKKPKYTHNYTTTFIQKNENFRLDKIYT